MDMVKIGKYLAELRKENNLTQEQLGEELGVTNKTVSRWENGNYLPPVEMLQLLSEKYGITINEILSGETLDAQKYKEKAEENIKTALKKSVFSVKEQKDYFRKKWLKEHCLELIFEMLGLAAAVILGILFYPPLTAAASVFCIVWSFSTDNRKNAYIEDRLCSNEEVQAPEQEKTEIQ